MLNTQLQLSIDSLESMKNGSIFVRHSGYVVRQRWYKSKESPIITPSPHVSSEVDLMGITFVRLVLLLDLGMRGQTSAAQSILHACAVCYPYLQQVIHVLRNLHIKSRVGVQKHYLQLYTRIQQLSFSTLHVDHRNTHQASSVCMFHACFSKTSR